LSGQGVELPARDTVQDDRFFVEAFGDSRTWQVRKPTQRAQAQSLTNRDQVFSPKHTERLATTVEITTTSRDHYSFLRGEFGAKESLGDTQLPRHPHHVAERASHRVEHRLVTTHKTTRSTNRHHEEPSTDDLRKGTEDEQGIQKCNRVSHRGAIVRVARESLDPEREESLH
jgi:hypothetical protein